jgi:hypothetical protein
MPSVGEIPGRVNRHQIQHLLADSQKLQDMTLSFLAEHVFYVWYVYVYV